MFRLSALSLFVASVAVAAPVPKGKEAKLYYPVMVGAKRVMVRTSGPVVVETVQEVIRVDEKDGKHRVTVTEEEINHLPVADGRAKPPIVSNREFVVEVSGNGLFRPPAGGSKEDPQPLLDLSVKPGATWTAKGPGDSTPKLTYTMGKEEELEVPAGKFTALRVEFELVSGISRRRIHCGTPAT
ncbi:MAG: hypothetical protein ABGY75_00760 [Gemmataceae bacterium]